MLEKLSPHNPSPSPTFTLQDALDSFFFFFPAQIPDTDRKHKGADNKIRNPFVAPQYLPRACCVLGPYLAQKFLHVAAYCRHLGSFQVWLRPGPHLGILM